MDKHETASKRENNYRSLQRNKTLKIQMPTHSMFSSKSIKFENDPGDKDNLKPLVASKVDESFSKCQDNLKPFVPSKVDESFSKCQYIRARKYEEIKEEMESSS
eukprot:CAMPEP_0168339658 /NCGR_PEP_ID=MMETSP0213-20121227/13591_1 /TAXON_ID=151035 /ORGANISM="Euplotes harpa, Strain FSP1.4" /LENGTH=103 /DNA_ID=CAMNT_0008345729 /DNA_START=600 /DNA_END=911 /DNA_ORIENTATION=-